MSPSFSNEGEFSRALANELGVRRSAGQVSQGTLAAELGIDQAAVSRVESGQRRLTVGETLAWFEALGFSSDEALSMIGDLWNKFGSRPPGFWEEQIDGR